MNSPATEHELIRAVVGLGNPGRRYACTRHNIGFMVLDTLSERQNAPAWREERQVATTSVAIGPHTLLLLKPLTFMNLSGHAVRSIAARHGIVPTSILVVNDDLDLPFGRLRLRPDGSAGGHNGLRSIAAELGTLAFPRLRVGIGRPLEGDPMDWVLAPFTSEESADLPIVIDTAIDIVRASLDDGLLAAMNAFNGRLDVRVPVLTPKPATTSRESKDDRGVTEHD